jgi:hypothetical protein
MKLNDPFEWAQVLSIPRIQSKPYFLPDEEDAGRRFFGTHSIEARNSDDNDKNSTNNNNKNKNKKQKWQ